MNKGEANKEFDVALSFAGEDRAFADYLARALKILGLRVFYDEFEKATLWGKNLYEYLHQIYSEKASFCIILVSKYYVRKKWTKKEWHSVQVRALRQPEEYLLPIRIDDTKLPGLAETIAYIDARHIPRDEIVTLVIQKISSRLRHDYHRRIPNVAISGSHPNDRYHRVCMELGKKLIIGGFRIVSGGTKNVGYQVSLGAYEYLKFIGANFYKKRDLIVTYTNENYPGFPAVKFGTPIPVTQPEVEVYRTEFIDRVDVLVSISGKTGTWKEYQLAKSIGKPVVPLASTGGSAKKIWRDMKPDIAYYYADRIDKADFLLLETCTPSKWPTYLDHVVKLLQRLSLPQDTR